jgi:hypothetical protein
MRRRGQPPAGLGEERGAVAFRLERGGPPDLLGLVVQIPPVVVVVQAPAPAAEMAARVLVGERVHTGGGRAGQAGQGYVAGPGAREKSRHHPGGRRVDQQDRLVGGGAQQDRLGGGVERRAQQGGRGEGRVALSRGVIGPSPLRAGASFCPTLRPFRRMFER